MNNKEKLIKLDIDDVNFKGLVLCAQKGCPNEKNDFSRYCNECYDEKYPPVVVDTQLSTYKNSLYNRVVYETNLYDNALLAAIDHLNMAHSHLFEEFEGRDHDGLLTKINNVTLEIVNLIKH
jgi:hypothetical protein